MPHRNYFEVTAKDNRELGRTLGAHFGEELRAELARRVGDPNWAAQVAAGITYLTFTETAFPQYIQELKGYAEGAGVPFEQLWALNLEDDLGCTSIVTNRGTLIGHTEDWEADSQDCLSVLRKTVGGVTILELYYRYTLGGNAASINSHGFVQTINTLTARDHQIGIPRNVVARWLSETADPAGDLEKLVPRRRAQGYNHTLTGPGGEVWNLESTAREQVITRPKVPAVHTNHYLTELQRQEANDNATGSKERYADAVARIKERMSAAELETLLSDQTRGSVKSIFNERTIGRVVFDLEKKVAGVWLKRETEKGWVDYPLDFI